jgi:hypothetical protein
MLRDVRLDEALGELGLSGPFDAGAARKAYLRLLKTRKPELDPEGFMRLREAFELVRRVASVGTLRRGAEAPSDVSETVPLQVHTEQPSPPLGGEALPVSEASLEPEGGGPGGRLVETEVPRETPAEPVGETRMDAPSESVPEESSETSDVANVVPAAGPSWSLTLDKPKEAADTLCSMLAYAKTGHHVPPELPFLTLEVLLRLHLTGSLKAARRLMEAFEEWLSDTANEVRLSAVMAVRWAMLRELWAVRHEMPLEVRAPIARGIASGDFAAARVELARFRRKEAAAAERAAFALHVHSNLLAPRVASALDSVRSDPDTGPSPTPPRSRGGASPWWMIFVAVQALLAIGRCASQSGSTSYVSSPSRPASFVPTRAQEWALTDYSQDVLAVVDEANAMGRADLATVAHALGEDLRKGYCAGAFGKVVLLRGEQETAPPERYPGFAKALQTLDEDVQRKCAYSGGSPIKDKR